MSFDSSAPITVRGVATLVHFAVPGATEMLILKSPDNPGGYLFSTARTPDMAKQGFSRFTVKPGQEFIVTGVLASGGQKISGVIAARADSIALPDGRKLFDRALSPP